MKIDKQITSVLIIGILVSLFMLCADSEKKITDLYKHVATLETEVSQSREIIPSSKTESLQPILDRLDKLETHSAEVDGDMNMLKLQQKVWSEEWKQIFEPEQKAYLRGHGK